jgi:hypothetical protein
MRSEAMKKPTRFLTNEKGEKIALVIEMKEYEKLLEELEDLEDVLAYHKAKASGETPIPFDQAIAQIEQKRR